MSLVIDLAIVAVIVLCAVRHYKLGLFCSVLNVGKFVAAIILAGILRIPLSLLALRLIYGEAEAGAVQSALAGMIAYVLVFAAVIAVSGFIIKKLSKIEIPIITRFDKLLGLALGIVIGAALCSLVVIVKYQRRRWLAGALSGALFSVAAFCCFSLLSASFNVDLLLLADIAIGALSGALTAMLVNLAGK